MAYIGHPLVGEQKYTIAKYSAMNDEKYQQLISYKVVFNFKSDAGILNYLNHKVFEIKP
jgi:23S rRNA pseudouridine955/2504/2580 synthase